MAVLKATKRSELGKNKVRSLRGKGLIPGIIYGHGEAPVAISVNGAEVEQIIHHGERVIELDLDGQMVETLVKDTQYDSYQTELIHVDFARVNLDEVVSVTVPLNFKGTPVGVSAEQGVFSAQASEINIAVQVRAIPEEIRINVAELHLGEHLTAGQVALPAGATLLDDAGMIIATVSRVVEKVAAEGEAAAAAEPEVIGAKKEEAEGQEAPKK